MIGRITSGFREDAATFASKHLRNGGARTLIRPEHTGGTSNGTSNGMANGTANETVNETANVEEFLGCVVAWDARRLKDCDGRGGDVLPSLSSLRRRQFELEKYAWVGRLTEISLSDWSRDLTSQCS